MNFLESFLNYIDSHPRGDRHDHFIDHAAFSRTADSSHDHPVRLDAVGGVSVGPTAKGGSGLSTAVRCRGFDGPLIAWGAC